MATREENINALTAAFLKLSAGVNLSDAVDSDKSTLDGTAATPKAVKTAYDLAVAAQGSADEANEGLVGVVRSVNGVSADAAGNVAIDTSVTTAVSSNYVRFNNGVQICFGSVSYGTISAGSVGSATFTFPAAFSSTPSVVASLSSAYYSSGVTSVSTSNAVVEWYNNGSAGIRGITAKVIAIGKWK